MKKEFVRLLKVMAIIAIAIIVKGVADGIALTGKNVLYTVYQTVTGRPSIQVSNYLMESLNSLSIIHLVLEGLILGFILIPVIKKAKGFQGRQYSLAEKALLVIVLAAGFETMCFGAQLIQFVGNGIWSAVRSMEPSIVLRNHVAVTRWLHVDYILRLCEGWLAFKALDAVQAHVRLKRRREARAMRRRHEGRE